MNTTDLLVIGGGVIGLSAAIAMRQLGYNVVVLEKGDLDANSRPAISRLYAINQASQQLLHQLGVWPLLPMSQLSSYRSMYVWDEASGAHIDFDASMILSDRLGYMVEESLLRNILLAHAYAQGVVLVSNYDVAQVTQNENQHTIQVTDDVSTWCATLLLVADGANSGVRRLLNVPMMTWSYHQRAIVATIRTEHSHQQTAYQVFLADGPLALLPMADAQMCSIVWSTTKEKAGTLLSMSDDDFNAHLMQAFGSKLGHLNLSTSRHSFPLEMRHVTQYAGSGWVLMGDAAHTIHPLAGLGLNVGLADLATWVSLSQKKLAVDRRTRKPAVLPLGWSKRLIGEYQRQRKANLWQIILLLEMLNRLFKQSLPFVIGFRSLGLTLTNRFMPLKRLLIEYAVGTR